MINMNLQAENGRMVEKSVLQYGSVCVVKVVSLPVLRPITINLEPHRNPTPPRYFSHMGVELLYNSQIAFGVCGVG